MLATVFLVACGVNHSPSENSLEASPEKNIFNATLYYPSEEYIVTGNEENKFIPLELKIETTLEELPREILKALLENTPPENGVQAITSELAEIKDVKLENNIAIVDFSHIGSGGSLDEELLIGEIVKSLTSVKEIEKVKFTMDGENLQTILGHFNTEDAIGSNFDMEE